MVTSAEPKAARRIGEYQLLEKIGEGGIAEIYKAFQPSLKREVAIKILSRKLTSDPELVGRFDQESLIIARLRHPNIIHVIDKGKTGDNYYFVMEYVDGTDFETMLSTGQYDFQQKMDVMVQLCKALDYAHKNNIVHRDVKPANILIDKEGNVLVADFGIAQIVAKDGREKSEGGWIMGTPAYMSPEQKSGTSRVDLRTDIYAVGVILYEVLTGRKPTGKYVSPSKLMQDIPGELDEIIEICLRSDPNDRFRSAVELKDRLLEVLSGSKDHKEKEPTVIAGVENLIGKCVFLDTVKEHPYGATYLVKNTQTNQIVVIKNLVNRIGGLKEARLLSSLKSRHILNIYGAGQTKGQSVFVMEYAKGGCLGDRMLRHYPWERALTVIKQAVLGLNYAHNNNIIHGNLRPSNILFDERDIVKLSDFGLPEHYSEKGVNWYGSPEGKKSKQADIYSLGIILCQMLTGQLPALRRASKDRVSAPDATIPERLSLIIDRMLAQDLKRRYQNTDELLSEIEDLQREPQVSNVNLGSPSQYGKQKSTKLKTTEEKKKAIIPYLIGFVLGTVFWLIVYFVLKS